MLMKITRPAKSYLRNPHTAFFYICRITRPHTALKEMLHAAQAKILEGYLSRFKILRILTQISLFQRRCQKFLEFLKFKTENTPFSMNPAKYKNPHAEFFSKLFWDGIYGIKLAKIPHTPEFKPCGIEYVGSREIPRETLPRRSLDSTMYQSS